MAYKVDGKIGAFFNGRTDYKYDTVQIVHTKNGEQKNICKVYYYDKATNTTKLIWHRYDDTPVGPGPLENGLYHVNFYWQDSNTQTVLCWDVICDDEESEYYGQNVNSFVDHYVVSIRNSDKSESYVWDKTRTESYYDRLVNLIPSDIELLTSIIVWPKNGPHDKQTYADPALEVTQRANLTGIQLQKDGGQFILYTPTKDMDITGYSVYIDTSTIASWASSWATIFELTGDLTITDGKATSPNDSLVAITNHGNFTKDTETTVVVGDYTFTRFTSPSTVTAKLLAGHTYAFMYSSQYGAVNTRILCETDTQTSVRLIGLDGFKCDISKGGKTMFYNEPISYNVPVLELLT